MLDLFEKRYKEELRDNTTGKAEDNDITFNRWKEAILEDRAKKDQSSFPIFSSGQICEQYISITTGYAWKAGFRSNPCAGYKSR
jgi:hypothetical protein